MRGGRQQRIGVAEDRTARKAPNLRRTAFKSTLDAGIQAAAARIEQRFKVFTSGTHSLGCGRGRRSAQVGNHVGNGGVGLVPDSGDHRHGAFHDHASQELVVEGH